MSINRSPLVLVAHATAAMPNLQVVGLSEPYDNDGSMVRQGVVDTQGNHWVICSPVTDQAGASVEAQSTLLRILHRSFENGFLPFDAPMPVASSHNNDVKVIVHAKMRGNPGSWELLEESDILVRSMAKCIAALHDLPAQAIEFTGLPTYTAKDVRSRLRSLVNEAVAASTLPSNLYERWDSALLDDTLFQFATVPVHGDLGPDSFLCSKGTVSSVSAFASAHLGDPAQDLAWILSASAPIKDLFLKTYQDSRKEQTDLHIVTRANLWAELALLRWLLHGKRTNDESVVADAKQMLKDFSLEVGDAPLVPGHSPARSESIHVDLSVIEQVLPTETQVDPDAPTVNLSSVLLQRED